jgi:hypothetical protein
MRKAQKERTPGTVGDVLRRKMPDHLADLLDEYGQSLYAESVLAIKDELKRIFEATMTDLTEAVQGELGRRGVDESGPHFKPWMNELVEDINNFGMQEVSGTLEDLASSYSAEYIQDESEEGAELFAVEDEDLEELEEVSEEEIAEPAEEEEEAAAPEGETLEELFGEEEAAADTLKPRTKRPRPTRREVTAMRRRAMELLRGLPHRG